VLILAIGALASAFAPNFWFLLICRAILGVGIGGDYPVSATIMSEYSGKQSRGRMIGLVFAMQGAGLLVGPLLAAGLLASGLGDDTIWRILLAFGALPGMAVFYLRRQIHETPRFALAGGAADEAEAAIAAATAGGPAGTPGQGAAIDPAKESVARQPQGALEGFRILLRSRRMLFWLLGTAGTWALLDFCYYGNSISTPEILALLNPAASLLHNTLVQLAIFAVFAVPGYIAAILLLDRTGRDGQRRPVHPAVRHQLLLYRVRAQHHHVRLSRGDLPGRGPHHGARRLRRGRQAGRVRRRLPVPGHARLVAGHPRRGDRRRGGRRDRAAADADPAARAQGQEPGRTGRRGVRARQDRTGAGRMTYRIVVGVDGSPHSLAALRWALDQAASRAGGVTAVLAWQVPFVSIPGAFDRAELEQAYRQFLIKTVSEVVPSPRVPLATVLAEGDPTESLIAASQGADVLVLGIRGRTGFAGLMLGSVSQACAANASCPVVLVKRTDETR
jgi:nucleotide-binding universal stress UspA family protein